MKANLAEPETLDEAVVGADALYVNVPRTADRSALTINGFKAAIKAGVKHLVAVSVTNVAHKGDVYEQQFTPLEEFAKSSGVAWTVLRLPFFIDNFANFASHTVKTQGNIYFPINPTVPHLDVSIKDIGEVRPTNNSSNCVLLTHARLSALSCTRDHRNMATSFTTSQ